MKSIPSPVALFVYNRPVHTRRTVEALVKNEGATDTVLHIFSDQAKYDDDLIAVNEVRKYIRGISGFKDIVIVEQAVNFGLAKSIISGVTNLCEKHGRVIVLEDDLETSPYFLKFMNEALDFYENTPEVMHVSGCRYPVEKFGTEDTFFLHVPLCWGWATWRRAWVHFEKDISIMNQFNREMINKFDFDNTHPYWKQLEMNRCNQINTWFVFWYAKLFLNGGLSLFPNSSLVRNIGHDSSGTHCRKTSFYDVVLTGKPISITDIPLVISEAGSISHKKYFRKISPKGVLKIFQKLRQLLVG